MLGALGGTLNCRRSRVLAIYYSIGPIVNQNGCLGILLHPESLKLKQIAVTDRISRARIFKLLRCPRSESKEPIPPGCVAWRAGTTTLFLLGSSTAWKRSFFMKKGQNPCTERFFQLVLKRLDLVVLENGDCIDREKSSHLTSRNREFSTELWPRLENGCWSIEKLTYGWLVATPSKKWSARRSNFTAVFED